MSATNELIQFFLMNRYTVLQCYWFQIGFSAQRIAFLAGSFLLNCRWIHYFSPSPYYNLNRFEIFVPNKLEPTSSLNKQNSRFLNVKSTFSVYPIVQRLDHLWPNIVFHFPWMGIHILLFGIESKYCHGNNTAFRVLWNRLATLST